MRNLMLTTALVAVASTAAIAQTADTALNTETEMMQSGAAVPAFLVSDFTGKNLHTLDSDATRTLNTPQGTDPNMQGRNAMRWESGPVFLGERDMWNDVGTIDDVVVTKDGELRGVLVDVGGFLGFGARTVMVSLDELFFVADEGGAEDIDDFFVVATLSQEELEALPEWDASQLQTGFETRSYGQSHQNDAAMMPEGGQLNTEAAGGPQTGAGTAGTAEGMNQTATPGRTDVPQDYIVLPPEQRTVENLLGANVYGREGENIATVDDLLVGDTGEVTHAIMDVGGFLGLGTHTVALEIDDLDILWNDQNNDVRVQVTMTQAEMESLPQHGG